MTRFLIKAGLFLLVVWALSALYLSDDILFDRPERKTRYYQTKLGEEIAGRHPIALLVTFDEPIPREWITGSELIASGVEAAPGRHGLGRRFTGTRWSMMHTPVNWLTVSPTYSISMWIKLLPPPDKQDILFSFYQQRHTGLRLEEGQLTFHIPAPGFQQSISYPFTRWEEFVHITAVADPDAGVARLYENGRLMAEGPIETVDFPSHNIEFGTRRWYVTRDFLNAVVDETVIWNKALSESEIKRLYRSHKPILAGLDPSYYRKWRWTNRAERGLKRAVKYVDYFNPLLHPGRIQRADIPEIQLFPSNPQLRHFNRAHYHSLRSGRRTVDAADFKNIEFLFNGKASRGKLALDGSDMRYGSSPRKAFLLDVGGTPIQGMRSVRLTPPEDLDFMIPLMDARVAQHLNLPHTHNGLCRLYVSGQFAGVYYFEDDTRMAVSPEASYDYMRGPTSVVDWPFLFRRPQPFHQAPRGPSRRQVPISKETLQALYDDLEAEVLALLIHDGMAPMSNREVRYRLRLQREQIGELWIPAEEGSPAEQVAAYITPFMLLGGNPSPHYIREDLELRVFPLPGLHISWSSSDPGLIDPEGRVTPPDGDLPGRVVLTAHIADDRKTVDRSLTFRVMPEQPRIPAFMIYVNDGLQKHRRVDCRVEYYAPGNRHPDHYRAFHGSRAGVKFRGNTSFWQRNIRGLEDFSLRKIALSLRFEDPHHLLNDTATRHMYFATGYSDTALIRNKLSYDLFKAMSEPDAPRSAPDVQWAEVFLNGQYRGMYENNTRIDRHKLGFPRSEEDAVHPAVLYKFEGGGNNFGEQRIHAITQKQPPRAQGTHWEPYRALIRGIRSANPEEFGKTMEEWVDVDYIRDYHLLLNLTENIDGINVNLYVARDAGPEARLFIVPWDYDKTFGPGRRHRWHSNALTTHLMENHPDYANGLNRRWAELRQGPWSNDAVRERIAEMERHLNGVIQWDYEIWNHQYNRDRSFEQQVEDIRTRAQERLAHLDRFIPTLAEQSEDLEEAVQDDHRDVIPDAD